MSIAVYRQYHWRFPGYPTGSHAKGGQDTSVTCEHSDDAEASMAKCAIDNREAQTGEQVDACGSPSATETL